MRTKELISKYLAAFWVVVLFSFMGLQISNDLSNKHSKTEKDPATKEFFLATAAAAQAPNVAPDLKILQPWIPQSFSIFALSFETAKPLGFTFHSLLHVELIRLLKATISINAP